MEHNLLMDAIIVENEKFAKQLIAHGADVTFKARASHIHPPIDPIACWQHLSSDLRNPMPWRGIFVVRLLTMPLCVQDKHGVTTLIRAAHKGLVDVVKLLVESKKVDVDAVSDEKITALIAAAGEGHEAVGASTAPWSS